MEGEAELKEEEDGLMRRKRRRVKKEQDPALSSGQDCWYLTRLALQRAASKVQELGRTTVLVPWCPLTGWGWGSGVRAVEW